MSNPLCSCVTYCLYVGWVHGDGWSLQATMNMLAQAQGVCGSTEGRDEDMVDYINVLRESVLDAYSGIVQVRGLVKIAWCAMALV